jgi:CheY-like chemotaxis protein
MSTSDFSERPLLLLVEDDPTLLKHYRKLFSGYHGIELVSAVDAGKAWDVLAQRVPGVVVLDLMMPYGSADELLGANSDKECRDTGVRLLRQLRVLEREQGREGAYVVVLTGRADPSLASDLIALLAGKGRVFHKPASTLTLEVVVCDALRLPCLLPPVLTRRITAQLSELHP